MKVLFLTPWYPSEKDAMLGLFVQKHVEAVRAQGVDVRVIFSQGWIDLWRQWRAVKHEWGLPDVVQLNVIQKQGLPSTVPISTARKIRLRTKPLSLSPRNPQTSPQTMFLAVYSDDQ